MIFFLALPRQQAWVLLNWLNAKVYVNSILAMYVSLVMRSLVDAHLNVLL